MPYGQEQRYEVAVQPPSMFLTRGAVTLILLMIAGYILFCLRQQFMQEQFELDPSAVLHGRVWQLATYLFVDESGGSLVMNCICVLFVGGMLEREWRTRSFITLWFVAGISCALIWMAVSMVVQAVSNMELPRGYSAASAVYGLLGALALAFRRRRLFFGIEVQYVVLGLVIISMLMAIPYLFMWIWLAGAGVGYLYVWLIWRLREGFSRGGKPAQQGRFKDLG
jgi:membrane associated rhomboid family serine protease